jgi:hypothetical protein
MIAERNDIMKRLLITFCLASGLLMLETASACAHDEARFPDWSGQWSRVPDGGVPRYDPSRPLHAQGAPLKAEYQALHEASKRDIAGGRFGRDMNYRCFPSSMPRMMTGISFMEFLISPSVTHVLFEQLMFPARRVYTDGRTWPSKSEPSFTGYSIGKWVDTDADGMYDVLEVETRNIRSPKVWDQTGMPMADDNDAIVTERIYQDKNNSDLLLNEMTTIDNSLTRPWSATKRYRRSKNVMWVDYACVDGNPYIVIEGEAYVLGIDGKLSPTRKDQPLPDLRHFQ